MKIWHIHYIYFFIFLNQLSKTNFTHFIFLLGIYFIDTLGYKDR